MRVEEVARTFWREIMKKLVLAAALTASATAGFAGAPADPIIEAPVIVEEAAGTSGGVVLPLILLAVLVAALD